MTIREYTCFAHGEFEAETPVCPFGCTIAVEREFRTAPGTRSSKTKGTDAALQRLAQRFGMTDMSNRGGNVAASQQHGQPAGDQFDLTPRWGAIPKGGVFHQGGRIEEREGSQGGAASAAAQYHTGRIKDEPMATEAVPLPLGTLPPKPRPRVVGRDSVSAADFSKAMAGAK
jgi:hypothetical protein